MADYERTVLDFYQLPTAFPSEWPAEKDRNDESDEEEREDKASKIKNRKSRYQALERAVSGRRSMIPGSEGDQEGGLGNLVQKDEPDPLGTADSVVRALRVQGLSLQDDARLRTNETPPLLLLTVR
jgi:exocyst complex component 2